MTAPSKFAHIVYRTHRFSEMIDWYTRVFEARLRYRDERFAFLSYDDEHHRMAFVTSGRLHPASRSRAPPSRACTTSPTPGRTSTNCSIRTGASPAWGFDP